MYMYLVVGNYYNYPILIAISLKLSTVLPYLFAVTILAYISIYILILTLLILYLVQYYSTCIIS
jgi:hypothetical protein